MLAHPDGDGAGIEMRPLLLLLLLLGQRLRWGELVLWVVGVAEDVAEEGL